MPGRMELDNAIALVNSLKSSKSGVRRKAARELGRAGSDPEVVIRQSARALRDRDLRVRLAAVSALAGAGSKAIPLLLEALDCGCTGVRRQAAAALGDIESPPAEVVSALARALRDDHVKVAQAAARALGQFGKKAVLAIPALVAALRERHVIFCRLASWALAQIGAPAVSPLTEALAGKDNPIAIEAAWALGEMGPEGAAGVPALVALLGDALAATGVHGSTEPSRDRSDADDPEPTLQVLIRPRRGSQDAVYFQALRALGRMGPSAHESIPVLLKLAHCRIGSLELLARDALAKIEHRPERIKVPA